MHSVGTPVLWAIFTVVIAIMLLIDISLQGKHPGREITVRQAVVWSFIWISLALLFALGLWFYFKQTTILMIANRQTMVFLTGYLLEKALAVDNVFVWLMLFNYFSIPVNLQRRVLIYGVLGAIVLRTIMIFTGSWLVSQFHWILYLFGIFLLFTGIKMFFVKENDQSIDKKPLVKWIGSHLRMTDTLHGERFFIRQQGILFPTPLIMLLILVEISDIIFAVDSIPAIFAVTTDPFIVLTSNLFAILGLRAMYFVLSGIAEKFSMLKYGLSIILIFIGIKMLLMDIFYIPTAVSLSIVAGILTLTIFINHIVNKYKKLLNY
ncbi:Inner membrane protein alx [Arsenophonus endosymbiont of Aleurodicus floccissimus]|uniref:TerC family protein n=1 Tax=Arsenophonus endosymbiont of Aleurodicus floccissimus TaxID=2152761 RepID=UPI000E6B137C|nr:TerC family protein [Arsenophonus endosymbiont of Aleurodicus floccissimus]SPP31914.1 Inner membrane protein alx [Arsenophonus endosymbiont of Aleurodicus floccissimus]